ncbi:unnamed protein product [Sphagnum jensenii]
MQKHGHKVHLILLRSQQDTTRSNRLLFCLSLVFFLSFLASLTLPSPSQIWKAMGEIFVVYFEGTLYP